MLTTETFRKAARDPAEFGSYYLSHYFTRRSPPFHRQLSALWRRRVMKNRDPVSDCAAMLTEKGTRSAIAAPRGHAKSTVMSLQNVLHAALFGYKRYILLVSDTEAQAVSFLDAIKNELETNERILADFGEQSGKTWKTGSILLSNGCRIDAVGSGQKLRGRRNYERRPDLILCDDIENDEGVRTAEQRQKTADWFWKAVCKSGDSYTDILVIGTILHHDSLLAGLLENPGFQSRKYRAVLSDAPSRLWTDWERLASDLTDPDREKTAHAFYFKHRKEMLAGSKVLWPEKLSYYDLRLMRLTEGDAAFNSEMQNQPIDPAACLFSAQWFRYYNPAEVDFRAADFRFYGYCDPSLGRTASSDYSAIVTLAAEEDMQRFLPRARRKPRFPAWPDTMPCGTASSRICASASAKCAQTRRRACGCAASLILPVSKASRTRHLPRRRTALPWAMTRRFLRAAVPFWLLVSSSAAPSRVRT